MVSAIAAIRQLNKYLNHHNLSIEDIRENDTEVEEYQFNYYTIWDKKILFQLYYKLTNANTCSYRVNKQYTQLFFTLTTEQCAEMTIMYEILRRDYAKLLEATFTAFVWQNEIHSDQPDSDDEERMPLDAETMERHRRASLLAMGIEKSELVRRIGNENRSD